MSKVRVQGYIYDYAKEHNIKFEDGETYGVAYQRILDSNPQLHPHEELREYAVELLDQLIKEYGFKATRVFAYYPLIYTKGYHGFEEVYLYQNIHEAMGCTAKAFMVLHKINDKFDRQMFQHEFKEAYREKYGYLPCTDLSGNVDKLISYLDLIYTHFFDSKHCEFLQEDLKIVLERLGDKHFIQLDLTIPANIVLLYEVCGITYGFHQFRGGIFRDYDGYGHVVSVNDSDFIINDFTYILGVEE